MNLFSVIVAAVAGWLLFGRTRLNCQRGNKTKNRLSLADLSNEPEYLQIFVKNAICPVCGSSFHIGFQAFYGDNETWLGGLFSLYPVDEKKKLIYFSNWIKKDRALLPKGSHLDNCPECGHPYPLEGLIVDSLEARIALRLRELIAAKAKIPKEVISGRCKWSEIYLLPGIDELVFDGGGIVMALEEKFGFAISDKAAEKKLFDPSLAAYRDEKTILDFVHCIAEIVKMEDSEAKK